MKFKFQSIVLAVFSSILYTLPPERFEGKRASRFTTTADLFASLEIKKSTLKFSNYLEELMKLTEIC